MPCWISERKRGAWVGFGTWSEMTKKGKARKQERGREIGAGSWPAWSGDGTGSGAWQGRGWRVC